jgi:glycosyltransferase involved in cell wall biosynthesis
LREFGKLTDTMAKKTKISCLVHAANDARTIGRTLETLHPCDEILVVDHGSTDSTVKIARQYGARIIPGVAGVDRGAYAVDCAHDWVLCLLPTETLTEGLAASLFEWKAALHPDDVGGCIALREEKDDGWDEHPPEMRLVNRQKLNWQAEYPTGCEGPVLTGELLRLK